VLLAKHPELVTAAAGHAKSDIWAALLDTSLSQELQVSMEEAIQSGKLRVALLEATLMMVPMPALGIDTSTQPDNGKSYLVVNSEISNDGRFHCPDLPSNTQTLVELCCHDGNGTLLSADACQQGLPESCPNPYEAYAKWCDPLVCTTISPKPLYLYTMQILAACTVS
jgi:hypothetical protein